ncbi:endonuclease III [Parvularcula sp. IMCC14364]|uniref:endonuclease III domain-containing protein n=1 Tax=Parvularcula sp. IMCC14364 TaxID=3067902 RepID=UPI0027425414|nr:hypothetical protein [Parvularcula sp. IMCC14364]
MQMPLSFAADARLPVILDRLSAAWPPREAQNADPLSQLVFMLVSADTPSAIALAAHQRMRLRYPRWSDLRDEAPEVLLNVLRGVERAVEKAVTLPRLLQAIEDRHGLLELDFLGGWSTAAAREWLEALPGVDSTISAATLNFSTLRRTILTLNNQTARAARRLGLVEKGAPMSALDRQVMDRVPADWQAREVSVLYGGLRKLTETYCHQGKPECGRCPLNDLCPSASAQSASIIRFPGITATKQPAASA